MKQRDTSIDFLRCLGLLLIMLAHVNPPEPLFEFRTFDVVLMVLVNGMSFRLSYRPEESYRSYVLRRFRRLIVPTWVFMAFVLAALTVLSHWYDTISLSLTDYLSTFSLTAGIGYVWIILIYFEMALLSPLLLRVLQRWGIRRYLLTLVIAAPLYELLSCFLPSGENLAGYFSHYVIQNPLGYCFVCALGIALREMSLRQRDGIALLAALGWLGLAIVRGFPPIQDWKYPPTFYYLAYGIVVSLLLCRLLEWQPAKRLGTFRSVAWLSRNSFWLYFWHMIPVLLLSYEVISIPSWPLRYLVVLAAAVLLTGAHNRIKSRLFARRESISPSH